MLSICGHLLISALTPVRVAVGSAIAGAVFTPKLKAYGPQWISQYALAAGVPALRLTEVVTAILGAGGMPVEIEGLSAAQVAAVQLGRLQGYARAYSWIYYTIIPAAFVAAIGRSMLSVPCTGLRSVG
jgi:hypothetical protein